MSVGQSKLTRSVGPAITDGVLELFGETAGINEQFLRHAATDHAGAANSVFLGETYTRAMRGSDARGAYPARAAANNEKIIVKVGHGWRCKVSIPEGAAMMASAAMPMNSPCSTTPGTVERATASDSGSAIRANAQSATTLPLSVRKSFSLRFRRAIAPVHPARAAAASILASVARAPKARSRREAESFPGHRHAWRDRQSRSCARRMWRRSSRATGRRHRP